jgi:hypothetical protein
MEAERIFERGSLQWITDSRRPQVVFVYASILTTGSERAVNSHSGHGRHAHLLSPVHACLLLQRNDAHVAGLAGKLAHLFYNIVAEGAASDEDFDGSCAGHVSNGPLVGAL